MGRESNERGRLRALERRTRAHSGLLRVASEQPTDADGGLPRFIDETKAQPEKKGAARRGDFSGAESQRTAAIGCGLRVAVLVATSKIYENSFSKVRR